MHQSVLRLSAYDSPVWVFAGSQWQIAGMASVISSTSLGTPLCNGTLLIHDQEVEFISASIGSGYGHRISFKEISK